MSNGNAESFSFTRYLYNQAIVDISALSEKENQPYYKTAVQSNENTKVNQFKG